MAEADALPVVIRDLAEALIRQGFDVTASSPPDQFGDRRIELTRGHHGVLLMRDRGRWRIDLRLIDLWCPVTAVEAGLDRVTGPLRRPSKPPTLEQRAASVLDVVQRLPTGAAPLRELRDAVRIGQQRRPGSFLRRPAR